MPEPGPAPGGCWLDVHPSAAVVVVVEVTAGEPVGETLDRGWFGTGEEL